MSFQLSPQQMAEMPVGTPPPGVIPDFAHPTWRVPEIYGVGITFLTIATIMYFIRMYAKMVIWKAWRWEDTTMTLGLMTTITYFVIMAWSAYNGSIGKHGYEIHLDTALSTGSFAAVIVSFALLQPAYGFIKATLFLQYYHLFSPIRWMRICIYIGLTITVGFYTGMTIVLFWCFSQHPGESKQAAIFSDHWILGANLVLAPGIVGIILDWYLLILPIPAVMRLSLSRPKKLGVISVFLTGVVACVASIITLYLRVGLSGSIADPSWDVVPIIVWAMIELTCGLITANAPFIHLIWNRYGKLMWITTKIKSSAHVAFGGSAHDHSHHTKLEDGLSDNRQVFGSPTKFVELNQVSDDCIFITRSFSVDRSRNGSETTKVHSLHEMDSSDIETPLPAHIP